MLRVEEAVILRWNCWMLMNFKQSLASLEHFDSIYFLRCFKNSGDGIQQSMVEVHLCNEMITVTPIPVSCPYKDNKLYLTVQRTPSCFLCRVSFSLCIRGTLTSSIQFSLPVLLAISSILLFPLRQCSPPSLSKWTRWELSFLLVSEVNLLFQLTPVSMIVFTEELFRILSLFQQWSA